VTAAAAPPGPGERLAVAAGSLLLLWLLFFRHGLLIFPFTGGTNGVFLDQAVRVLAGEVMYRDFFEFVMPGTTYLYAGVFGLLGPTTRALGWALLVQGALLAALMHALASRVAGQGWRLLPPAALVTLAYAPGTLGDHKWPALAAGLSGLLVLTGGALSAGRALAAGLLLGASVTFTQDLGLGLAAGALAGLALSRPVAPALLALAAGCAALPLLVAAGFALLAGFSTMLQDCVVFPLTRYREFNVFSLRLATSLRTLPRELAQLLLAAAGLWGALLTLRRERRPAAAPLAGAGLGMLLATLHRGLFPAALAIQASLLLPLAAVTLERWPPAGRGRWLRRAALAILGLGLLHGSVGMAAWRQGLQPLTLETHRAGSVWVGSPMPELLWLERNSAPGERVFLLPARGGHYFVSATRDATTFPYLIEGQSTPEQAAAALAQIVAARPRVGLWDVRPGGAAPAAGVALLPLRDGLLRDYEAVPFPNGALALRLRPGRSGADGDGALSSALPAPRDEGVGVIRAEAEPPPGIVEQPELAPQLDPPRHALPPAVVLEPGKHGRLEKSAAGARDQPTRLLLPGLGLRFGQQAEQLAQPAVERPRRAPAARAIDGRLEALGARLQQKPQVEVTDERHAELVDRQRERVIGDDVGVVEPEGAGHSLAERDAARPDGLVVDPMARALDEAVVDLDHDRTQQHHALVIGRHARGGGRGRHCRHAGFEELFAHGVHSFAGDEQVDVLHRPEPGPRVEPAPIVGSFQQYDGLALQPAQEIGQGFFQEVGTPAIEPLERAVLPQRDAHELRQAVLLEQQRQQPLALGLPHQASRRGRAGGRPGLSRGQELHQGPERRGLLRAHARAQSTPRSAPHQRMNVRH
jgi:hypothetical protein